MVNAQAQFPHLQPCRSVKHRASLAQPLYTMKEAETETVTSRVGYRINDKSLTEAEPYCGKITSYGQVREKHCFPDY